MKISRSYVAIFGIIFWIGAISVSTALIRTDAKTPETTLINDEFEETITEPEVIMTGKSPEEIIREEKDAETRAVIAENFGSNNEIPKEPEYRILVCGQGFPFEESSWEIFDYYDYENNRAYHIENGVIEEMAGINYSDYDICFSSYSTEYIE